ncbi:hypothetical protein WUBG_14869, partial [Wuchereria bancrofti]
MDSLKMQIDAYASSLDGFDVLLERGIKFLRSRAERYEKVVESSRRLRSGESFSRNGNMERRNSSRDSSLVLDDEGDELIIPPLTPTSLMMMTSSSDYFQFAYGELSETDTEAINPSVVSMSGAPAESISDKASLASTSANCDTDIEMARSFVLRGWGQIEDTDTFMALMDRVPASKIKHSLEENMALIDSRIQYLEELKAEAKLQETESDGFKSDTNNDNDDEDPAPLGKPIECFGNQGVGPFLESMMRSLENMLDNSLYVTLQTTSVLAALASYPQPLIAHYLFDQRMLLQPNVKNLFKVMDSLKMQIDAYASSLDGFDVLLERGIKFLRSRAERYEKVVESVGAYDLVSPFHETATWKGGIRRE